jgi:hypothetical protein
MKEGSTMKSNRREDEPAVKLFEGERALVLTGVIGFFLAGCIAIYMLFKGPIILPEGNMKDAFSFNAALGMFILSIAAILPLTTFTNRKRKAIRSLFIVTTLYSYTVETLQNFRGISPRFSRVGIGIDIGAGILFGVVSLVLVTLIVILAIHFWRMRFPHKRPLLILGIRYAFLSAIAANIAGIWMIMLQDRLTGEAGNLIVLHGIGFHALQTLILPAWLLEKVQINEHLKKVLVHTSSFAWMVMILLIGIQTGLGKTVFESTLLPFLSSLFLLVWFGTLIIPLVLFYKQKRALSLTMNRGI